MAGRRQVHRGAALIVEDEPIIMLELKQMLSELGWHAAHLASDIDKAVELARCETFDIAILDVNVRGKTSVPVADILQKRKVPIILATGYSTEVILGNYPQVTYLQKPYLKTDLAKALALALDLGTGDKQRRRA